ncbi:hypothetical protein H4R18_004140, partial [Coemansia javaensis]
SEADCDADAAADDSPNGHDDLDGQDDLGDLSDRSDGLAGHNNANRQGGYDVAEDGLEGLDDIDDCSVAEDAGHDGFDVQGGHDVHNDVHNDGLDNIGDIDNHDSLDVADHDGQDGLDIAEDVHYVAEDGHNNAAGDAASGHDDDAAAGTGSDASYNLDQGTPEDAGDIDRTRCQSRLGFTDESDDSDGPEDGPGDAACDSGHGTAGGAGCDNVGSDDDNDDAPPRGNGRRVRFADHREEWVIERLEVEHVQVLETALRELLENYRRLRHYNAKLQSDPGYLPGRNGNWNTATIRGLVCLPRDRAVRGGPCEVDSTFRDGTDALFDECVAHGHDVLCGAAQYMVHGDMCPRIRTIKITKDEVVDGFGRWRRFLPNHAALYSLAVRKIYRPHAEATADSDRRVFSPGAMFLRWKMTVVRGPPDAEHIGSDIARFTTKAPRPSAEPYPTPAPSPEPHPPGSDGAGIPSSSSSSSGSGGSGGSRAADVDFVRFVRRAFEDAYGPPALVSATARRAAEQPGLAFIEHGSSQRDFVRDRKRRTAQHTAVAVRGGSAAVVARGTPADVGDVAMSQAAPGSAGLVALLRSAGGATPGRFVEIWRDGALERSVDVTGVHGDFYGDATFGCLAWSADAQLVVYAAERPEYDRARPDTGGPEGDCGGDCGGGVADPRRYRFEGDWGETFGGKRAPALVVVDVRRGAARVLPAPDGVSPGQALFLGSERLAFTGYHYATRKHGIVYCQNRPSAIYACDARTGGGVERLYGPAAVRSPRATPSQRGLVFLATAVGGPHAGASAIVHYDLATREARTLVPVVDAPAPDEGAAALLPPGFPGVYADQLPAHPWLQVDGQPEREILAFSSTWRSAAVALALDVHSRVLSLLTPADGSVGCHVLAAASGLLVAAESTPAQPERLAVGTPAPDPRTGGVAVEWARVPAAGPAAAEPPGIAWEVRREGAGALESIFVHPVAPSAATRYFWPAGRGAAQRPLVVMPHGGPHSTYTASYNALAAGLARLGFGVLLVNFTGSLGFGQDAVRAQIGRMDTLTLDEIQAAARRVHADGCGDPAATVYLGGSYSGYTGALLAGTAPGFYRAIALRNPVISIGENAATSDIPDWCWAELGLDYAFDDPPELTPDVFARMWRASPARLVAHIRDPLLLLLGADDRRVPPPQSLAFYHRLRAAGAPVQCKIYPAVGHPLDTVEAERDSFVSMVRFFAGALKGEDMS